MSLLAGQKELCKSNSVIVFDCALLTLYFSENIGNHFHWWNRWETMSQSNETVDSESSMQITVESSKCLSPYNVSAFFFFSSSRLLENKYLEATTYSWLLRASEERKQISAVREKHW